MTTNRTTRDQEPICPRCHDQGRISTGSVLHGCPGVLFRDGCRYLQQLQQDGDESRSIKSTQRNPNRCNDYHFGAFCDSGKGHGGEHHGRNAEDDGWDYWKNEAESHIPTGKYHRMGACGNCGDPNYVSAVGPRQNPVPLAYFEISNTRIVICFDCGSKLRHELHSLLTGCPNGPAL